MNLKFWPKPLLGYIIIIIFINNCHHSTINAPRLGIDLKNLELGSFDNYISHVDIIPLETSEESIIKRIEKVIEFDNKYFIQNSNRNILVFNSNGVFIKSIGKSGRGPGELAYIVDFQINHYSNNIEILEATGNLMVFDLNGEYLHNYSVPTREVSAFTIINEDLIMFSHNRSDCGISVFSRKNNKIIQKFFEFSEDFFLNHPFAVKSHFYKYNNEFFLHHSYMNKLYKYENNTLNLFLEFNFGNHNFNAESYRWPQDLPYDKYLNILKDGEYVFGFHNEFQTDRYIFILAYFKSDEIAIIYDKKKDDLSTFIHIKGLIQYDMSNVDKYINFWSNEITTSSEQGLRLPEILNRDSGNTYAICSFDYTRKDIYLYPEILNIQNLKTFEEITKSQNPVIIKYFFKN